MTDVPALAVENVTMKFGGVMALDDVSFTVEPHSIHAVIGPNGAGKSTCFNVISGLYRATSGRVLFGDKEITGTAPHHLAAAGIGRAFQNIALSPHDTVFDNVMLGRHALTKGGFLATGVGWPSVRREQRKHGQRVLEICDFLGIGAQVSRPVGQLSYGDEKRVDIARALATEPRLLMLDEPAAGMNSTETAEMAQLIRDIARGLDISVLLVEHDMALVMAVADHITVLDFGSVIGSGTPSEIRNDQQVIAAYLGTSATSPNESTHGSQEVTS